MTRFSKGQTAVNAFRAKLHNSRVHGGRMKDGTTVWQFKRLTPDGVQGRALRLSREAAFAMARITFALFPEVFGVDAGPIEQERPPHDQPND